MVVTLTLVGTSGIHHAIPSRAGRHLPRDWHANVGLADVERKPEIRVSQSSSQKSASHLFSGFAGWGQALHCQLDAHRQANGGRRLRTTTLLSQVHDSHTRLSVVALGYRNNVDSSTLPLGMWLMQDRVEYSMKHITYHFSWASTFNATYYQYQPRTVRRPIQCTSQAVSTILDDVV